MKANKTVGPTTVDIIGLTVQDAQDLASLLIDAAPFDDESGETAFKRIYKALAAAGIKDSDTHFYFGADREPVTLTRSPIE